MKKFAIALAAAALILGMTVGTSYLYMKHFNAKSSHWPSNVAAAHQWVHSIGLSPEQEKKLEPMEASLQKDIQAYQVQLAQERMALCGVLHTGSSDSKELDTYVTRIGELEAQQQRRVVRHLVAMRDLLTPEQKDKFFSVLMREICECCRTAAPGQKCLCGMHNMQVKL